MQLAEKVIDDHFTKEKNKISEHKKEIDNVLIKINSEIKIFNSYEPSWGGATSEAYERHTTFGGNGAGNWF